MFKVEIYELDSKTPEIRLYDGLTIAVTLSSMFLKRRFTCTRVEIYDENDLLVHFENYNYNLKHPHIIQDFKAYAKCCRDEIGMREMDRESFLWFAYHGYIEFFGNKMGVSGGLWTLTDRFREVGLAVRNGELPPEFKEKPY